MNTLTAITAQISTQANLSQSNLNRQLAKAYAAAEWMADISELAQAAERRCLPKLADTPMLQVSASGGLILDDVEHLIKPMLQKRKLSSSRAITADGRQVIRITEDVAAYHTYQTMLDVVLSYNAV